MSVIQQEDLTVDQKFDEFSESCPKEICIPADDSPSALLPPEEIVFLRDKSSKGVVYRAKVDVRFKPSAKRQG